MSTPIAEATKLHSVANLLVDYLLASPSVHLPGTDGMLMDDVIAGYESLAVQGQVPAEAQLCERHPELAAGLVAFFHMSHQHEEI